MRHRVAGRTFGRRSDQRKALLRGLATSLIEKERIETTLAKAKELRRVVEPLITLAKKNDLHSRRIAASRLYGKGTVRRLFDDLAPRFKERPGGYTRIFKMGVRRGDGAPLAMIEFVSDEQTKKVSGGDSKKKASPKKVTKKKVAKKKPSSEKSPTKKKTTKKKTKKAA